MDGSELLAAEDTGEDQPRPPAGGLVSGAETFGQVWRP